MFVFLNWDLGLRHLTIHACPALFLHLITNSNLIREHEEIKPVACCEINQVVG